MAKTRRRSSPRRSSKQLLSNPFMAGLAGGAAARVGAGYLGGTWGPAAGLGVVGWYAGNDALMTLAGAGIGSGLAGQLSLPGMSGGLDAGGLL